MKKSYSEYLSGVFAWMAIALAVSGAMAFVISRFFAPAFMRPLVMIIFCVLELALVFLLARNKNDISVGQARMLYMAYSVVSGITLSSIFVHYQLGSVFSAFLSASLMFAMCWLAQRTIKADLSKYGSLVLISLVALLFAEIITIFTPSISRFITFVGIVIFIPGNHLGCAGPLSGSCQHHAQNIGTDWKEKGLILSCCQLILTFCRVN